MAKMVKKKAAARKPAARGAPKGAAASKNRAAKAKTPTRRRGENDPAKRRRADAIYRMLERTYPEAKCALQHDNAFELLVATILSAQCTDERVNKTTPTLFERYPDPAALAASTQEDVEQIIRSCGFYRNKAKAIRGAAAAIVAEHAGNVPATMDQLLTLPGVARKTANVVLGNAFGVNVGVVVDTHVARLSHRMGLTSHTDPVKIERDLMALFDPRRWTLLAHLLIWHGRRRCAARKPDCEGCEVRAHCPRVGVGKGG